MTGPWIIAFVCLVGVVLGLATILLGLVYRIIKTLDSIETSVQSVDNGNIATVGPRAGAPLPDLPGLDLTPRPTEVGADAQLVLFVESGCEPCQRLLADIRREPIDLSGVVAVAVVGDSSSRNILPDGWQTVIDDAHSIADGWQVSVSPFAVVSVDGSVVATGLPNSRRQLDRLVKKARRTGAQNGEPLMQTR